MPSFYRGSGHRDTTPTRDIASLSLLSLAVALTAAQAAPLDPPTPEAVAEARQIVQQMKGSPRGPYSRIRWFCNDGSVQPPVAFACQDHGGGRQHAEYSAQRDRLAALGWSVGTVFAALTFDELFASEPRQGRLRELPLERYLTDIDNGWVIARAGNYRGRVQVEDESAAGAALLEQLVAQDAWAAGNFLLVREAARTIPHGSDTDLARSVRRDAVQLAEMEPAAETWRAEIHSRPGRDIAPRLRTWAARQSRPEVREAAEQLATALDQLYGLAGRRARIDAALAALRRAPAATEWRAAIKTALDETPTAEIGDLCRSLTSARAELFPRLDARQRVALLDAMQELEATVQITWQEGIAASPLTRRELIRLAGALVDCSFASGLISNREARALAAASSFDDAQNVPLDTYRKAVATLKRTPGWALGTLRHSFAEALVDYTALDPRAARFSDDLLRGSPLWVLGDVLERLARDADTLAGSVTELGGRAAGTTVALNPGIGRGTLRVFATIDAVEHGDLRPTDIVALPETLAELAPVAGILTLGEGNALSHVELLARNFGIPNVAIDYKTADLLERLAGQEVLLLVGSNGDVLLRPVDDEVRDAMAPADGPAAPDGRIEVPMPDLGVARVLDIAEIGRKDSGKLVGPKAANLGELNRLFPGRVSPAVALPFGVYAKHIADAGLDARIADAFDAYAAGTLDTAALDAALAQIRAEIAALQLDDDLRGELAAILERKFGASGSFGVFVRSDTNVEDLPQFTGAGLNETLPNVVGFDAQLTAIARVWSSVFSPRALAWRAGILANPERTYASVLLMKSVPSTKSGVLVTANLADRAAPGLTASAAWGVGGAVAGEAAESIVILPAGTELLSDAESPWQRHLAAGGGIDWLPAPAGQVLDAAEVDRLRALAAEVGGKYEPVPADDGTPRPWDIEFGFVDGELTLFQIRPLVEKTGRNADALLRRLMPRSRRESGAPMLVDLDQLPASETDAD
jgi:Pyruvate phosphate dikinase, AMP/ATP-binding domain